MSIIGTGVAAGVAQTAQQAQQVSKRQKRAETETSDDARRLREKRESHRLALDEDDTQNSTTQVRIDGQVPHHEHRSPMEDVLERSAREEVEEQSQGIDESNPGYTATHPSKPPASQKPSESTQEKPAPSTDTPISPNAMTGHLYKHLDVTG